MIQRELLAVQQRLVTLQEELGDDLPSNFHCFHDHVQILPSN